MRFPCADLFLRLNLLLAAGVMSLLPSSTVSAADTPRTSWRTDVAEAEAAARKANRPLLIHFYADWCGPCRKMERETFGTEEFRRQIHGRFVAVKVNTDKQPDIAKRFAVNSLPTDLVITPTGQILARSLGYRKKTDYLATLARWESKFEETSRIQIAGKTAPRKEAAPTPKHRSDAPTKRKPQALIGMDGYSPVALHENRTWIEGRREFTANYQGVTYWMASANEQTEFQRDPRRYAPRLLGCDPVILQETDRAVSGIIDYGAFFDGELYFFATDETRKRFRNKPLEFTRTRHVLRIKEIGGTVRR